jgi:3-methylcrotonyl-CoA carboxylase alpha subunit
MVVFDRGEAYGFSEPGSGHDAEEASGDGAVTSPMPGQVVAVHVRDGERVERGAALLTVEAMKMEHTLAAPLAGRVEGLDVRVGQQVAEGAFLARVVGED